MSVCRDSAEDFTWIIAKAHNNTYAEESSFPFYLQGPEAESSNTAQEVKQEV